MCAQVRGWTTHLRGLLLWEPRPAPRAPLECQHAVAAPARGGWQAPGGPGRRPSRGRWKGCVPSPVCPWRRHSRSWPLRLGGLVCRGRGASPRRMGSQEGRCTEGGGRGRVCADPGGRGELLCLWTPETGPLRLVPRPDPDLMAEVGAAGRTFRRRGRPSRLAVQMPVCLRIWFKTIIESLI